MEQLVECERHEALLNLAFVGAPAWWLVCPYDTQSLSPVVLEEAHRNHPFVTKDGYQESSDIYRGVAETTRPFDLPLPAPGPSAQAMRFAGMPLGKVRTFVAEGAMAHGLGRDRTYDLVMAVNEVVTNSLRHGGGSGVLRMWANGSTLTCEVEDAGHIADPMVGRTRPTDLQSGGLGLWLVNQLCDLVQVRTFHGGSVVRLHMSG